MKQEVDVLCEEIERLYQLLQLRDREILELKREVELLENLLSHAEGRQCQS